MLYLRYVNAIFRLPMTLQTINTIIVSIGVPAIVGALIYIGKKLRTLTIIEIALEKVKHNMKVMGDYLTRYHTKFDPRELQAFSPYLANHPEIIQ